MVERSIVVQAKLQLPKLLLCVCICLTILLYYIIVKNHISIHLGHKINIISCMFGTKRKKFRLHVDYMYNVQINILVTVWSGQLDLAFLPLTLLFVG